MSIPYKRTLNQDPNLFKNTNNLGKIREELKIIRAGLYMKVIRVKVKIVVLTALQGYRNYSR